MNQHHWDDCQGEPTRGSYLQQDIPQQEACFSGGYNDPEYLNNAYSSNVHEKMQPNNSKESSLDQISKTKQIRVSIYDRSHPNGKMIGDEKKTKLLNALHKMMYKELLSDADISPRFRWSHMVDDVFRLIAVGEASAEFLRNRVHSMPPPWPGAKLEVRYKLPRKKRVEMYVPGEFVPIAPLTQIIRKFDHRFPMQNWTELNVRPDEHGHIYTISIDPFSFKLITQYNGYIPYEHREIRFRPMRDFD